MNFKTKNLIPLILLPLVFLSLHYFVYLGNYKSPFDGNESFADWFILVSNAPAPLDIEGLVLDETAKPSYLNPFASFKYGYAFEDKPVAVVLEEKQFLFGDLKITSGNLEEIHKYLNPKNKPQRSLATVEYPNGLFFLVQYMLVLAFAFSLIKLKSHKL